MENERVEPDDETQRAEAAEAAREHISGREPTPEEEEAAERHDELDESVREHEREMLDIGANEKGEGRPA